LLEHEPVQTSEQAAEVRGVSLASGAKAIVASTGSGFQLAVMSACKQINSNPLKKAIKTKNLRFATVEEVWELTKCLPGAVPPFGSLLSLPTILDQSLIDQGETINFNVGLRTHSLSMSVADYVRFESPQIANFTK
jgi:Ala-tRNA(Pro) deacylase